MGAVGAYDMKFTKIQKNLCFKIATAWSRGWGEGCMVVSFFLFAYTTQVCFLTPTWKLTTSASGDPVPSSGLHGSLLECAFCFYDSFLKNTYSND